MIAVRITNQRSAMQDHQFERLANGEGRRVGNATETLAVRSDAKRSFVCNARGTLATATFHTGVPASATGLSANDARENRGWCVATVVLMIPLFPRAYAVVGACMNLSFC